MKTMTEKEPIRSDSPELNAMSLPKLKEVASQLGIEGAPKLKKDALVQAIADLQAMSWISFVSFIPDTLPPKE